MTILRNVSERYNLSVVIYLHELTNQEGEMRKTLLLAWILLVATCGAFAQGSPSKSAGPYAVEYYYKVKWGHSQEFLDLFKKNHYPLLKKGVESGRMLNVSMQQPQLHMTEDARWDYRVTIVFKNATVANEPDPEGANLVKQLYPDQDTFKKEEQRRFEILLAHWDLPVTTIDLEGK
jgi:hypothetical protein